MAAKNEEEAREEAMETESSSEGKKRIHFGSLEEKERERLLSGQSSFTSSSVLAGIKAGNINITSDSSVDVAQLPDRQKVLIDEFEKKKRVRSIVVPTSDSEVKAKLREMGQPISYSSI
uniref:Uncharacterized protein n=1 Tax=Amphimedon queenslandica TaxID=400682 RepID=A0A1X7SPW0_AMPQE